jgi:hypothetical protein
MNAYTTRGEARIQPRDLSTALRIHGLNPGSALAVLEKQRGWQAEAEMERVLKQYGVKASGTTSLVALLRETIATALVSAGERLAGSPRKDASAEAIPEASTLGTAS